MKFVTLQRISNYLIYTTQVNIPACEKSLLIYFRPHVVELSEILCNCKGFCDVGKTSEFLLLFCNFHFFLPLSGAAYWYVQEIWRKVSFSNNNRFLLYREILVRLVMPVSSYNNFPLCEKPWKTLNAPLGAVAF